MVMLGNLDRHRESPEKNIALEKRWRRQGAGWKDHNPGTTPPLPQNAGAEGLSLSGNQAGCRIRCTSQARRKGFVDKGFYTGVVLYRCQDCRGRLPHSLERADGQISKIRVAGGACQASVVALTCFRSSLTKTPLYRFSSGAIQ